MTTEPRSLKEEIEEIAESLVGKYGFSREVLYGENGIALELHKALVNKALQGEMTYHLGYAKGEKPEGEENCRNGYSKKTVLSKEGKMEINQPRDRQGSFQPLLIEKGQKRFDGWDDKIIGMYARGMSVREIRAFLIEQYKIEVSPDFISTVTDSVIGEIKEWQNRPLEEVYAIVYFDALRVKIRHEGVVKNKAVYCAPRKPGATQVKVLSVELNGSRPKEMSGKKSRGRIRKRDTY